MANDADHVAAILPEPFVVLGQKLKPLTLGHFFWLEKLDCKSVGNLNDLICAILVCTNDWQSFERTASSWSLRLRLRVWQWRLSWRWRKDKGGPLKAINLFNQYLNEACTPPDVFTKGDNKGSIGTPWLYHLKAVLQSKLGYTRAEALSLTMREAVYDYYAQAELNGTIELVSESDREMQRIANENHNRLQELGRERFGSFN